MAQRSVNKVLLIGIIGKDAEQKYTPNGKSVTKFSVATAERYKQGEEWKEKTNWANVVLWGSEGVVPYLLKGKQVYIEGKLETRSYDDKDGKKTWATDVIASEVMLLGGKGEGAAKPSQSQQGTWGTGVRGDDSAPGITDDDVPF